MGLKKNVTGKNYEKKKERNYDNRNVVETLTFVSDSETYRKRVPSMENQITIFPQGGNVTDLSNFTFPSSLQNTETRYSVLNNNTGKIMFK